MQPEATRARRDAYARVDPEDGRALLRVCPRPRPCERRLMVEPLRIGICRSDVKELAGKRSVRRDFGHELVARVVAPTPGLPEGALVGFDPHVPIRRTSGFAELLVADACAPDLVRAFPVAPTGVALEQLVLWEPLACATHAFRRVVAATSQERLDGVEAALVGGGITGTLIGLLLRRAGARVTVFNRGEGRRRFLTERGLFPQADVLPFEGAPRGRFDVVVPTASMLDASLLGFSADLVRREGCVLLFGGTASGLVHEGIDVDDVRRRQRTVRVPCTPRPFWMAGTHGATSDDFTEARATIEEGALAASLARLLADTIALREAPSRLMEMKRRDVSFGKTVVDPTS